MLEGQKGFWFLHSRCIHSHLIQQTQLQQIWIFRLQFVLQIKMLHRQHISGHGTCDVILQIMTFMTLGNKDVVVFYIIRSDSRNLMLEVRRVSKGCKHSILPNFRDRNCCCIVMGWALAVEGWRLGCQGGSCLFVDPPLITLFFFLCLFNQEKINGGSRKFFKCWWSELPLIVGVHSHQKPWVYF